MVEILSISAGSAEFTADGSVLLLQSPESGIMRVRIGGGKNYVSPTGINASAAGIQVEEGDDEYRVKADGIDLAIHKSGGRLNWYSGGSLFLSQPFPDLTKQAVITYKSSGGESRSIKTVDGERSVSDGLVPVVDPERGALRARVYFDFSQTESLHGLGQAEEGIYDYRENNQFLYQHNMRIPVPFLISSARYGIFFDCGCLMTFNSGTAGGPSWFFLDTVDALDFYIIRRNSFDAIISGMRRLSGRAALLPKWAYGFLQSKEAYKTQDELVETAREYRRRHIPLDCVIQDWNTWEPGKWGNKRLDKSRYPDMNSAVKELHNMNIHTMISIWPNMNKNSDDNVEFTEKGGLLLNNNTYDAFDEKARKLYWEQVRRELFSAEADKGFDSFWCDSTEPFTDGDWNGEIMRESWERFALVGGEHKKYLDPALANLYALFHAKGIYQNQRSLTEHKRVFNLTRSGWAGSQRYGAALWSGDITAAWSTLRTQITEGLNFCMSGLPWWTLDIGGFFTVNKKYENRGCGMSGNRNPLWFWRGEFEDGVNDPGYRELYTRWLQFAAFLPLFRSHGTDTPREIWNFGEEGTPFYDAIAAFIKLRYTLMPYIYSLAGAVVHDDYTMMRSLLFDFSGDPEAAAISQEFMFGPALLVCPVTAPMYYAPGGAALNTEAVWECYLPRTNADWYEFRTGKRYPGGTTVTVPAPLETIPLFVRPGSIIPMESKQIEYACEDNGSPLEIRVYPGADGSFILYEDSGDGYAYEKGEYNRINLRWDDSRRVFTIGDSPFDFNQSIKRRGFILHTGNFEKRIDYTGRMLEVRLDGVENE
jgi:alpha-D-xyloside xylohydrolase